MTPTQKSRARTTAAVKGIGAEVRGAGFSWLVTIQHLGNNGYTYYKWYDGKWNVVMRTRIPPAVRRSLVAKIKVAIAQSLPRPA